MHASIDWPTYEEAQKALLVQWKKKYPLPLLNDKEQIKIPAKNRNSLLCARLRSRQNLKLVCYYRFQVELPWPERHIPTPVPLSKKLSLKKPPPKKPPPKKEGDNKRPPLTPKASQKKVGKEEVEKPDYNQTQLKPARTAYVWLQCLSNKLQKNKNRNKNKKKWKWRIYFMRLDLLPGRFKRWRPL